MADNSGANTVGIVAGGGGLPRRLVEACQQAGREVFVLALEGAADHETVADVPHAWCPIGAAGRGLALLRENNVRELVLAGGVKRPSLVSLRPDWRAAKFFARVGYRALGDDGLLSAVVAELEREGFRVIGPDQVLRAGLASEGPFGRISPDAQAMADIAHGARIARALGGLDIGQAAIIQQGLVLGVEAIEGTDALLRRCGELRREGPGGVLVKIAKPGQERRADLPTIGVRTVAGAKAAGLRGIAVEAGSTLVLDREGVTAAADAAGLFVIGLVAGEPQAAPQ
jgi:UDP-2,3-diacylglucosamine hydrolase